MGKDKDMGDDRTVKPRTAKGRNGEGDPLGANSEIGRKLRQYYEDLVSEEIPDRFAELLGQLERQDRDKSTGEED